MRRLVLLISTIALFVACQTNNPVLPTSDTNMPKSPKRGACFNFNQMADLPLMTPAISWFYNWGNTANESAAFWFDNYGIDFCPMIWNGRYSADAIRKYVALHPQTKYLLAFNEPNLTDQANMTPAQAAALWPEVVALAKELHLKLVAPAMNYGTLAGYSDPIKWLDEFFAQNGVSIDDVDALSIHCYMASSSALIGYVERFYKYNKPIWMTEFCAWEPGQNAPHSVEQQMDFMVAVLNYFEQNEHVERYAWFMPRVGNPVTKYPYMQLLTHDLQPELTPLGMIYNKFSSFDKSVSFDIAQPLYSANYVGIYRNDITIRVSSEDSRQLMLALNQDGWTDYQVFSSSSVSQLQLRYATAVKSRVRFIVDGVEGQEFDLPSTGGMDSWTTVTVPVSMKSGKHTLRVMTTSGGFNFGWIKK